MNTNFSGFHRYQQSMKFSTPRMTYLKKTRDLKCKYQNAEIKSQTNISYSINPQKLMPMKMSKSTVFLFQLMFWKTNFKGWDPINRFSPAIFLCLYQTRTSFLTITVLTFFYNFPFGTSYVHLILSFQL